MIVLFVTLAYVGLRIAARIDRPVDPRRRRARSPCGWSVQAAINIGYVVGLLPVTGIPLPLVSSGGTSLALALFAGGLLANFARHEAEAAAVLRTQGPGPSRAGPAPPTTRALRARAPRPLIRPRRHLVARPAAARPLARCPSSSPEAAPRATSSPRSRWPTRSRRLRPDAP